MRVGSHREEEKRQNVKKEVSPRENRSFGNEWGRGGK